MTGKNKFLLVIVGVIVVLAFWIYYVSVNPAGGNQALVKFLSIEELKAEEHPQRVKLGGNVREGSIQLSEDDLLEVQFVLEQGSETLPVRYRGTRPDLFKDGAEVIVEGEYRDTIFVADQLQTKCASRYEGDLRDESSYRLEEL
jgi:cytochrome c-type biogenesis protein CcmE